MVNRSTDTIPRGDAWAYTPEMQVRLRRAIAAADAGHSYRLSEEFLLQLVDAAERAGGALSREELTHLLEVGVRSGEIARVGTDGVPNWSDG